jgi:circadian clock protein KaiB
MKTTNKEGREQKPGQTLPHPGKITFVFRLYVTGATPRSLRAIENARKLCETYLKDRYELSIIDILQQPALLKEDQILATPTLIRKLPPPVRKLIGDLSAVEKILVALDIKEI